jgi:mannose-6-phosphate isomerase-like protein (cupin superfamily)
MSQALSAGIDGIQERIWAMTAVLSAPTTTSAALGNEAIWMFGDRMCIKVAGRPAEGGWSATERTLAPNKGVSPRVVRGEETVLYVLEGLIGGYCGDQTFQAGAGSVIHLPADLAQCWRAMGDDPARVLVVTVRTGQ